MTCAHCVRADTVAYQPSNPTVRYPVTIKAQDETIDLAIIEIKGWLPGALRLGDSKSVKMGTQVSVYGFPDYSSGSHTVTPSVITFVGVRFVAERLFLSTTIYCGNSGGPVLNRNLEVVGVVQRGTDVVEVRKAHPDQVEFKNNAISIHELTRVKS